MILQKPMPFQPTLFLFLVSFSFKTIAPVLPGQDWYQKMLNFLAHLLRKLRIGFLMFGSQEIGLGLASL